MGHGADSHFNLGSFIFALVNFLLFAGGILFFMRKKIFAFLQTRSTEIKKQIGEATRVKEETFRKFEELDARLSNIDSEIKAISDQMAKEGGLERERLIAEGARLAQKIIDDLALTAVNERRKLEKQIKEMIFGRSYELLKEFLNREENKALRHQMGDHLINSLIKKGDLN
jgi:F-type H+-transporting ATPase subunit b